MPNAGAGGDDGFVVWIEGLPCAGKTTLSRSVAERLRSAGRQVEVLDGDEVRHMFSPELGFSRKDREFHARRVSYVARMLARHGVAVLVAMITPYETSRQAARATVGDRFDEIWLSCPIEVCRQRDTKGLYRTSAPGGTIKVTGVDDPFEEPLNPDLTVDTSTEGPADSTRRIVDHLVARGLLRPPAPPGGLTTPCGRPAPPA
jgi:adenylylsulfate kinase